MSLDDEFRWCVYCGADCEPAPEEQRHAADCATVTGIYPLDEDDLAMHLACVDCGAAFQAGDSYLLRDADIADGAIGVPPISFIVCLDCGWRLHLDA